MKKLIFLLIATLWSGVANADQLASWNFQDIPSGNGLHWDITASTNAAVKDADIATAVVTFLDLPDAAGAANALKAVDQDDTDLAGAIASDAAYQIELAPVAGKLITVTQMVVTLDVSSASHTDAEILVDANSNGFDPGDSIFSQTIDTSALVQHPQAISINGSTSAIIRIYGYNANNSGTITQYGGLTIGEPFNSGAATDDIIIYGTVTDATGPAEFAYTATPHSIKPGEPQNIDVVIRNDNFNATNVVSTLTSANGQFSVLSGSPVTNAALAGGASITNTFSVQAVSNTTAQTFANAFNLNISGYGNDNIQRTTNDTVNVSVLNTASVSMDSTAFAANTTGSYTNTLTVSNAAAFGLQFTITNTEAWLSAPLGTLSVVAGGTTNINVIADASQTPGQGQYSDTLEVIWLNNGSQPNPTNFPIIFDVGPKVSPLTNNLVIVETGGVNDFGPNIYEPGEILEITVTSTNDGAITVNNITNDMILPAGWGVASAQDAKVYTSMDVGDSTSTTYQISIPANAADGDYDIDIQNDAGTGTTWSDTFTLNVYNRANPSVSPTSTTVNVAAGGTASVTVTLTNAGNASTTYSISGGGMKDVQYFAEIDSTPVTKSVTATTEFDWSGTSSDPENIGFDFSFNGQTYTEFTVNQFGALVLGTATVNGNSGVLPNGNNPVIAPFWGDTEISQGTIRYTQESDKLIVTWDRNSGNEFQAWLYTNGQIRFVYDESDWGDDAIGVQDAGNATNLSYEIGSLFFETILLTPSNTPWATPGTSSGSLGALSGTDITFTIDASGQTTGSVITNTITWGNGSSSDIIITIDVSEDREAVELLSNRIMIGNAGSLAQTNFTLKNTGNGELNYVIANAYANGSDYQSVRTNFAWDSSANIGPAILSGTNHTDWISTDFDIPYHGNYYSQFYISTNGTLALGTTQTNYTSDQIIAPFYLPTLSGADRLRYYSDVNKLVVRWGDEQMFQAVINRDGTIRFQYSLIRDPDVWPNAQIYLSDTSGTIASGTLVNDETSQIITNSTTYWTNVTTVTTNVIGEVKNMVWVETTNFVTNTTSVLRTNVTVGTVYDEYVLDSALFFTPTSSASVIFTDPTYGTLAPNASQTVTLYGDARGLTAGGPNSPIATTVLEIRNSEGNAVRTDLVHDQDDYEWDQSGSASNEYYLVKLGGGDPDILEGSIYKTNSLLSSGTLGSLAAGEWAAGDNDSLGFDTVYVWMENAEDPDGKENGYLQEAPASFGIDFMATNSQETAFPVMAADDDNDGMSNQDELLAGTNSKDAASVFSVEMTSSENGVRTISWPTPPPSPITRNYIVQYTTDLTAGWTTIEAVGNKNTYTDDHVKGYEDRQAASAIYYRVIVE